MPPWSDPVGNGRAGGVWANDGFAAEEEHLAVDPKIAFSSLAFIRAALKRSTLVWCAFAVAGMLFGAALFVKFPAAYQASTTVLLKENPNEDPGVAIQTDAALAQSSPVAERVIQQLGLRENVSQLISSYTVLVVANDVLKLTVSASSSSTAVKLASALTTNFLQYRVSYYQVQQQQTAAELDQQFNQAEQRLNSIDTQISDVAAQPNSPAQQTKLNNLQAARADEIGIEQYVNQTETTDKTIAYQMAKYSLVLNDAATLPHSGKKRMLEDIAGGLLAGLAVGIGVVIVHALGSERLRRRDDVADALGTPVRLSVRSPRKRRRLSARRKLTNLDMTRVVAYLESVASGRIQGLGGLAVVAVDNARVVAPAVVSFALSRAREGKQVVVADLSGGAMAGLLGAKDPGVKTVHVDGQRLIVAVPEGDDLLPAGPLQRQHRNSQGSQAQDAQGSQALLAACASADLLLVLATLDPALGADHLATWATDAVVVVTAGESSATRIHAVGDMLRFAGTRLKSAVLIGADKSDESLGAVNTPDQSVQV
jgi:capsular polysaccharide biosynthesis protein